MANPQKRKGDAAELECARLINQLTGFPAERKLGAGRAEDTGDIYGVDDTTVQVANWKNISDAVRLKPRECTGQQANAHTKYGCTWIRLRGGEWRVVLTPEQWGAYARAASPPGQRDVFKWASA